MLMLNATELQELVEKGESVIDYLMKRLKTIDYITNLDYKQLAILDDIMLETKLLISRYKTVESSLKKIKYKEKKYNEYLSKVKSSKSTVAIATT